MNRRIRAIFFVMDLFHAGLQNKIKCRRKPCRTVSVHCSGLQPGSLAAGLIDAAGSGQ